MDTQLFASNISDVREVDFIPVRNRDYFNKPYGGLWTSTYRPETNDSEWVAWCRDEKFGNVDDQTWHLLTPKTNVNIYTIDTLNDLCELLQKYHVENNKTHLQYLDFEAISQVYDGIRLTSTGQWRTRLTTPDLYGWDCESTLWFGWQFDSVQKIKEANRGEHANKKA